jgi:hypothetical protein
MTPASDLIDCDAPFLYQGRMRAPLQQTNRWLRGLPVSASSGTMLAVTIAVLRRLPHEFLAFAFRRFQP